MAVPRERNSAPSSSATEGPTAGLKFLLAFLPVIALCLTQASKLDLAFARSKHRKGKHRE
jgi:hypothetical protein